MKYITIIKPHGWDGLKVQVEASLTRPGEYEVGVYYRGWVGTAFSTDGMGWTGISFHADEKNMKKIARFILRGIERERPTLEKIVCKHLEKKLDEVTGDGNR